jgi:hypothetical protein
MRSMVACLSFAAILLLLVGCSEKPKTTLDLRFTEHPCGGCNVGTVSAEFRGRLDFTEGKGIFQSKGSPKHITATVEWWWENAYHGDDEKVHSDHVTFYSESCSTRTTYVTASPGYVSLNYWWVKIRWSDDDGSYTIESSKAYCYSLSYHSPFAPQSKTWGWIQGEALESEDFANVKSFRIR